MLWSPWTWGERAKLLLRSSRTKHFQLVQPYQGDGHEMVGCFMDIGEETAHLPFKSPRTEFLESVQLYQEDGLEMVGCTINTGGETVSHC